MCEDYVKYAWLSVIYLRYFNLIGAHALGLLGEVPRVIANNLFPYIFGVVSCDMIMFVFLMMIISSMMFLD